MKTDRELLELAAKAAGIVNQGYCSEGYLFTGDGESGAYYKWKPLTDDGDALRLAVKLNIPTSPEEVNGTTWVCRGELQVLEPHNGDPYAATRRAIVRAAAAIGENL